MSSHGAEVDLILKRIETREVVDLAVAMGNVASPSGNELPMADFLEPWLKENGFPAFRQHVVPERDNVIGTLQGRGGGRSLLFNSHMDTQVPDPAARLTPSETDASEKSARREGDKLLGVGIVNDKGPMAAFMVAAKALRESGVKLRGDVILSMVVGEIGTAPVDEFQGHRYLGKGLGARHLVDHGVFADGALVAEATNFGVAWAEAGAIFLKLTVYGQRRYTPYLNNALTLRESNHAVLMMAHLIPGIHEWALEYEQQNTLDLPYGRMVPKVGIGAIRAGRPYNPSSSPGSCSLYFNARLLPDANPNEVVEEVKAVCRKRGVPAEIEVFLYRPGSIAQNIEPFRNDLEEAHRHIFGGELGGVESPETSMWRDLNVFNRAGIPSLTYGPGAGSGGGGRFLLVEDLVKAAQVYALTAYSWCR